jgi:hypothetical protein
VKDDTIITHDDDDNLISSLECVPATNSLWLAGTNRYIQKEVKTKVN